MNAENYKLTSQNNFEVLEKCKCVISEYFQFSLSSN